VEDPAVRRASPADVDWIVGLSARVQAALTASGSLQQIGPLPRAMVESAVQAGNAFLLEVRPPQTEDGFQLGGRPFQAKVGFQIEAPAGRVGSVLVDPAATYPALPLAEWGLDALPPPHWYLHALMLEPSYQGRGLGKPFLDGVQDRVVPNRHGTIILDCWAGNHKLRDFYHRAGFRLHGVFPTPLGFDVAVFVSPAAPEQ
jgi:GNAT superfamily N-acetyltransferase